MACNTLVRSQVEYASSVWSPYTKENINKIDKVQRRATRWASNDYSTYSSVTDMLSNLGWRSLEKNPYRNVPRKYIYYPDISSRPYWLCLFMLVRVQELSR